MPIDIKDLLNNLDENLDRKTLEEALSEKKKKKDTSEDINELLKMISPDEKFDVESAVSQEYKEIVSGTYTEKEKEEINLSAFGVGAKKKEGFIGKLLDLGFLVKNYLSFIDNILKNTGFYTKLMRDLDAADMGYNPEEYIALALAITIFGTIFLSIVMLVPFIIPDSPFPIYLYPLIVILSPIFIFAILLIIPSSRAQARAKNIEKELPFALRHLATEIKAGVGLVASFESIAKSDYGDLSREFERIVIDIRNGKTTEEALKRSAKRVRSPAYVRAIMNFIRAIRTGGAVSEIISNIAKDTSYELNMKIRDFVEKLSMVGLIFIMIGVVLPVMISILGAIAAANPKLPLSFVDTKMVLLVYLISIVLLAFITYFIKLLQPI